MTTIAIFADVPSLWFNAKRFGEARVDYRALRLRIAGERIITRCQAYLVERGNISGFTRALKHMNYETTVLPPGDAIDVVLAMDALKAALDNDVIAIAAGEGRYTDLFVKLKKAGKQVEVYHFPIECPMAEEAELATHRHLLDRDVLQVAARAG